jgi:2-iminobutanoate/2-iminopropanoate deaminase
MPRQIVHTTDAAQPPRTYSQAVRAGGLVFVSGTGPYDPKTGGLVGATIQEQVRQCLTNIAAILAAAGSSLDKVASATVILREDDVAGLNEEWLRWFPTDPPARQAARLPVKVEGLRVSIAVVAEADVNHQGIR